MPLKEGDFGHRKVYNLLDTKKQPIDLTGRLVYAFLKLRDKKFTYECTVLDAELGQIELIIEDGTLFDDGDLEVEVRIEKEGESRFTSNRIVEDVENVIEKGEIIRGVD